MQNSKIDKSRKSEKNRFLFPTFFRENNVSILGDKIVKSLKEFADCKHAYWKCESCGCKTSQTTIQMPITQKVMQLEDEVAEWKHRAIGGTCKILSQGSNCDCALCKRDKEIQRLTYIIEQLPHKDDIETAMRANGMGLEDFSDVNCRCDLSVNVYCEGCAIDSVLRRVWKLVKDNTCLK